MAPSFSLKQRHRASFTALLQKPTTTPTWQIIIADPETFHTLSTLFPPSDLRRLKVTLLIKLTSPHTSISDPDARTTYILSPTSINLAHLHISLSARPSSHPPAHLALTSPISPPLLSALAAALPLPSPLATVTHLHASFHTVDDALFTLLRPSSPVSPRTAQQLSTLLPQLSPRLHALLATLSHLPILRAPPTGPAAALARHLAAHLRASLRTAPRPASSPRRRPLLLLLDRDMDHLAPLHHSHLYEPLIHDILDVSPLAKLTLSPSSQTYHLDKQTDHFFAAHANVPFPAVPAAIETALAEYRNNLDRINSVSAPEPRPAAHLADAVSSLPALARTKEQIDRHTNIATALLNRVNRRRLDALYQLERQISASQTASLSQSAAEQFLPPVLQFLRGDDPGEDVPEQAGSPTAPNANDLLRLFLIYYSVFGSFLSETVMAQCRAALHAAGADTASVEYLAKLHGFRHDLVNSAAPAVAKGLSKDRIKGMMTNVVNRGYRSFANVAQNAKNLVVEQKRSFAVARTLELFLSEQARGRYGKEVANVLDGYLMLDPKVVDDGEDEMDRGAPPLVDEDGQVLLTPRQKMKRMVFSDAVVFVTGAGGYVEYYDVMEMASRVSTPANPKNVLYGATELLTPEEFLEQLTQVAKEAR